VDGSNPETEWDGYHTFDELPQLSNPRTGFLQNCNSPPFETTSEGNPIISNYPAYMTTDNDTARARASRRILSRKPKFTFDEWAQAALSTDVIEAETQIPLLVEDWEKLQAADAPRAAKLQDMIDSLKSWDRKSKIESEQMTLFALWHERVNKLTNANDHPPPALIRIVALEEIKAQLERDWGRWRVAWGEINRLQRPQGVGDMFSDAWESVPVPGGPGQLGIIFTFHSRPEKNQKRRYGYLGNSYVAVIEFGPRVKARSVLVGGQSADPKSPHFFDQAELYSKRQFKPAWFRLSDIKSHVESVYHPGARRSVKP
jgi:acyl-homoserine lactone acylase PvdQ